MNGEELGFWNGGTMNAILKYPGAKWGLSKWILSFFPDHHSYLEPFFGSGAVFFHKASSDIETINDLDGNVVNFFAWGYPNISCLDKISKCFNNVLFPEFYIGLLFSIVMLIVYFYIVKKK